MAKRGLHPGVVMARVGRLRAKAERAATAADNGGPEPMAPMNIPVNDREGKLKQHLKDCYRDVTACQELYDRRAKAAKAAKADLDAALSALLEAARLATTEDDGTLPLFDQGQAEQDLAAMTERREDVTAEEWHEADA